MTNPQPAPETPNVPSDPQISATQTAGSVQAQQSDEVRRLAMALSTEDQIAALVLKGTVAAVNLTGAPPTISIYLSGDTSTTIASVRFIDSYSPVVGDTVLIVKQGSDLFALGQMNSTTASPAENGWVTPTLGSGFTTHSIDPVRYRVVVRDGDRIVEMRGGVTVSGTPTALWTMPSDVRPVVNLLPLLIARDPGGGSNVAQLQVNANGTMVLAGATTGVIGVLSSGSGTSGSTAPGTNSAGEHRHWEYNYPTPIGSGGKSGYDGANPDFTDYNGIHSHTVNSHTHTTPNHTHTMDPVNHPTLLSFNGVSYVL